MFDWGLEFLGVGYTAGHLEFMVSGLHVLWGHVV